MSSCRSHEWGQVYLLHSTGGVRARGAAVGVVEIDEPIGRAGVPSKAWLADVPLGRDNAVSGVN